VTAHKSEKTAILKDLKHAMVVLNSKIKMAEDLLWVFKANIA